MCSFKGPFIFIFLSITLNSLEATPVNRLISLAGDFSDGAADRQVLKAAEDPPEGVTVIKDSYRVEKRKCNTATCVTQRLADLLAHSGHTIGTIYLPTNVGSNSYGKRDREPPSYLQL